MITGHERSRHWFRDVFPRVQDLQHGGSRRGLAGPRRLGGKGEGSTRIQRYRFGQAPASKAGGVFVVIGENY